MREEKNGLDAVEHLWPKWDAAEVQMDKAEEEASQLGLAGYEYLRSRVEHFRILQEVKDEFGTIPQLPRL